MTPETLLSAYAQGMFPMADGRQEKDVYWYRPERRGILPLEAFHVPQSLQKFMRRSPYRITVDTAFEAVIRACADTRALQQEGTWINDAIIAGYTALARIGHAHSVECWQGDALVGGLYGVSLRGAFFGESMFSLAPNASKVALVHLVTRLRAAGYVLLDTQYVNPHLVQFGVKEIPRPEYETLLSAALEAAPTSFDHFNS